MIFLACLLLTFQHTKKKNAFLGVVNVKDLTLQFKHFNCGFINGHVLTVVLQYKLPRVLIRFVRQRHVRSIWPAPVLLESFVRKKKRKGKKREKEKKERRIIQIQMEKEK